MRGAPNYAGGIAKVGARVSWRGRPVMTIQRHALRFRIRDDNTSFLEPIGLMPARDATRHDLPELAVFLARKGDSVAGPDSENANAKGVMRG